MAKQRCIEDTEAECETTQAAALVSCKAQHDIDDSGTSHEAWKTTTTRWSEVYTRLDSKFDTVVCPHHDYGAKTVQDYNAADYAAEE